MKVNSRNCCIKFSIVIALIFTLSGCSTAAWREIAEQAQRDVILRQQAERAVLERQARTGIKDGPKNPSYRCDHYGSNTVCTPLPN